MTRWLAASLAAKQPRAPDDSFAPSPNRCGRIPAHTGTTATATGHNPHVVESGDRAVLVRRVQPQAHLPEGVLVVAQRDDRLLLAVEAHFDAGAARGHAQLRAPISRDGAIDALDREPDLAVGAAQEHPPAACAHTGVIALVRVEADRWPAHAEDDAGITGGR